MLHPDPAPTSPPANTPPANDPNTPPANTPPATPPANTPPAADQSTPPDGWQAPSYEEWKRQQNAIAASNKRASDLEAAAQKAADEEAAKQGQFQELAQREQEKAQKLEQGIKTSAVKSEVLKIAQGLGFRNPLLAENLITLSDIDATLADDFTATVDDAAKNIITERLNAKLATDPYLKGDPPRAQLGGAGQGNEGGASTGNAAMNDQIRAAAGRGTVGA